MSITPMESWIRPQDERFSIQTGQVQRITAQDLVGSDTGLNGSVITLRSVGQASHGSLSLNSDGSYSYSPAPGYVGNDSFSYTVQDQFGNTCTETVHIEVCPPPPIPVPNQAPVVMDEFVNVTAGSPVSAHESALLANDSDPDGHPLSIQSYGQPAHGTLSRAADGTLTYTAHADYSGEDSFTYLVSDGQGGLTQGTVHLNVAACAHNRPPVVMGEEASLRAGSSVSAPESLLLANDSDPEGGAVSLVPSGYSQPANGTLSRAPDGTLTYTPRAGFVGDDSFTYTVTDAQGNTSQGTVTLHVGPGMAAPTITTVDDNAGPTQGNVSKGGSTDDTTPTLGGTAEPGARVDVYDGTTLLGSTQADPNGQWSLTPSTPLAAGPHNFQVRATAADGASADSNAYDISITTGTPLSAPVVTLLDDANNDGTLTRNELNGNSRVDVRVDLPADSRVGDLLELQDNDGHGVSKRLTQADLDAKSVRFDDAFPLPAPNTTLVVNAQITGADGRSTPPGTDSAFFNGNFSPLGQDDVARLNSASTPMASLLGMSQDTAEVVPGGQTWQTSDGDAGRAVYGLLSSLLSPGMKVQVSSSDNPGVWFDAVVSADGLHWTAVDTQAHRTDWTYSARVLSPAGSVVSSSATQAVALQAPAAGGGTDLSLDNVLSYENQAALDSALWSQIEAGAGLDTLQLTGTDMRLELPKYSSTPGVAQGINNVERFDLGLDGRNTLEMSINDVLAQGRTDAFLPNGKTQVMVNGDNSDTLSLVQLVGHGGDSGNWVRTGTVQFEGKTYSVFEHSTLGGQVLAQQGLKVQVPAEPGTPAATAELPTTSGNVLANDSDPDGPAAGLRVAGVDNNPGVTPGENLGSRLEGLYGHLTLNPDGSYRYVADKSFGVTAPQVDVFYYLPKDSEGETALQPSRLSFNVEPAQANVLSVQGGDPAVEGETLSFTVNTSNAPSPTAMTLELLSGSATVGQDATRALQADLGQGWVDVVGGAVTIPAGTARQLSGSAHHPGRCTV
ncbi:MAG: Ig-like domain-containing protein [Ideonella sp.]|nr:Ig-like domain-containing protein [Ideonella sp.]